MTPAQACELWTAHSGRAPDAVTRLATGSANYVFLVEDAGARYILRAADPANREVLRGSVGWIETLAPLNLPIPRVIASAVDEKQPFVILNYLEGRDLGAVYDELTAEQKRAIARDVWTLQRTVESLRSDGYGYLTSPVDPRRRPKWKAVVEAHLARSRTWMRECGIFDESIVDAVERRLPECDAHLAAVEPRAFFDDATTKNVLIHQGRFSGLVDLDWLCFGDRLYTIALTRMSLLERGSSLDYIEFLIEEEGGVNRRLLSFYTLAFCVDFMAGAGMAFNKPEKPKVTVEQRTRLRELFQRLLAERE